MKKDNTPHTQLCEQCMDVKPTGLTMSMYYKWRDNIGQRQAIENAVQTLNANSDIGLLTEKVCDDCVWENHENGEGIEVIEHEKKQC